MTAKKVLKYQSKSDHKTLREWPSSERPREKMIDHGADSLSDAELLAILMRTGKKGRTAVDMARSLLTEISLEEIGGKAVSEIRRIIPGTARACAIAAAVELGRRIQSRSDLGDKPQFTEPALVAKWYIPKLQDVKQEMFWVAILSSSKHLVKEIDATKGLLNSTQVHVRECFREAIREAAASVIFIHNHPSGNPEPSKEDIVVTRQLVEAGSLLSIPVDDHIIVAGNGYTSFLERGLL